MGIFNTPVKRQGETGPVETWDIQKPNIVSIWPKYLELANTTVSCLVEVA